VKSGQQPRDAWNAALRLLARRDHSVAELKRKLLQRGYTGPDVEAALERGRQLGYLDEQRYAEQLAHSLADSGRAVGRRLELELKKRGIAPPLAEQVRAAVDDRVDHRALITALAARRYPRFIYAMAADSDRRRVVNFFLRRGFSLGEIVDALGQMPDELS